MRVLHHFPLCPFSRKVRLALAEKKLEYSLTIENFWERNKEYAAINPAMKTPALVEHSTIAIPDSYAICEYLEEAYPTHSLMGDSPLMNAGIRRLVAWFDEKFYSEVTRYMINEKMLRYFTEEGHPRSDAIRAANSNLRAHMHYLSFLTSESKYLMGENISLADLAAAAHISVIDYLGDIPWNDFQSAKEWYALIKSRPSFRSLLEDRIPGFTPPDSYANPDF